MGHAILCHMMSYVLCHRIASHHIRFEWNGSHWITSHYRHSTSPRRIVTVSHTYCTYGYRTTMIWNQTEWQKNRMMKPFILLKRPLNEQSPRFLGAVLVIFKKQFFFFVFFLLWLLAPYRCLSLQFVPWLFYPLHPTPLDPTLLVSVWLRTIKIVVANIDNNGFWVM